MSADPRLPARVASLPDGLVLKAQVSGHLRPAPPRVPEPTSGQVEHERSLWGPHPDPAQDQIERQLYSLGAVFLKRLLESVLGQDGITLAKADPPRPPGWGEVMRLFQSPAPPAEKLATWTSLVDGFTNALLPPVTVENAAAAWALRTALLHQIGERVLSVTTPGGYARAVSVLPPAQQEMVEWAKLHGAQFVTRMRSNARQVVLDSLVESQMGGGNHHALSRVLFERVGRLNRDWRRIAITETGMAVASGQLAGALAQGGEWEAVWTAGPKACPFCRSKNGTVLRIVAADAPSKDGRTQVWPGKNNVGRSAHPFRKDGTRRGPDELWWPCIPAHPNCACGWLVRRVLSSLAAKNADAMLSAIRAQRFAQATAR